MKLAKRITSLSDFPLDQISSTFPPPIGNVVKLFLNVCSKAKTFKILKFTDENEVHLCRSDSRVHLNTVSSVHLCLSFIINHTLNCTLIRSDSTIRSKSILFCIFIFFYERLQFQQLLVLPVKFWLIWVFLVTSAMKASILCDMINRLLTFKKTFSLDRTKIHLKKIFFNNYLIILNRITFSSIVNKYTFKGIVSRKSLLFS
jgi:hypothetical protein